jgi:hypothetical protein
MARDQRKAQKAGTWLELKGPISSHIDSGGHIAARFEERKDLGERISYSSGRSRYNFRLHRIDCTANPS